MSTRVFQEMFQKDIATGVISSSSFLEKNNQQKTFGIFCEIIINTFVAVGYIGQHKMMPRKISEKLLKP